MQSDEQVTTAQRTPNVTKQILPEIQASYSFSPFAAEGLKMSDRAKHKILPRAHPEQRMPLQPVPNAGTITVTTVYECAIKCVSYLGGTRS